MEVPQLGGRPAALPDAVVRYAAHADGIIDLHLPAHDEEPRPLVVFLHGGFWRVAYDRTHTRPLTTALAAEGLVVATPEYRRVGGAGALGGGWPTTFDDVDTAVRALPRLLAELGVRVSTTTVAGHSAGGHLALWLASERHRLDRVVALAPVGDLRAASRDRLGRDAVPAFLGGTPEDVPDRYDAADPATRLARTPPSCGVLVVHGREDTEVPVANSRALATKAHCVRLVELDEVAHYDLIDPASPAWPHVRSALRADSAGRHRPHW